MTRAIKNAAIERSGYLEREIQNADFTLVRLENSIKSIRSEILYWKTRRGIMAKELSDIVYELKATTPKKGKGKKK